MDASVPEEQRGKYLAFAQPDSLVSDFTQARLSCLGSDKLWQAVRLAVRHHACFVLLLVQLDGLAFALQHTVRAAQKWRDAVPA